MFLPTFLGRMRVRWRKWCDHTLALVVPNLLNSEPRAQGLKQLKTSSFGALKSAKNTNCTNSFQIGYFPQLFEAGSAGWRANEWKESHTRVFYTVYGCCTKKFYQTCFQTVFRDVSFQRFIQTLYYSRMQEFTTKWGLWGSDVRSYARVCWFPL